MTTKANAQSQGSQSARPLALVRLKSFCQKRIFLASSESVHWLKLRILRLITIRRRISSWALTHHLTHRCSRKGLANCQSRLANRIKTCRKKLTSVGKTCKRLKSRVLTSILWLRMQILQRCQSAKLLQSKTCCGKIQTRASHLS